MLSVFTRGTNVGFVTIELDRRATHAQRVEALQRLMSHTPERLPIHFSGAESYRPEWRAWDGPEQVAVAEAYVTTWRILWGAWAK